MHTAIAIFIFLILSVILAIFIGTFLSMTELHDESDIYIENEDNINED